MPDPEIKYHGNSAPATGVEDDKKEKRKILEEEEAQVIVHCHFLGSDNTDLIRIWKSTFLVAKNSGHKSKLIHAENISVHPLWTHVKQGAPFYFTLFFSALPKDCLVFDLVEEIHEEGGFEVRNISRNSLDVYSVKLN